MLTCVCAFMWRPEDDLRSRPWGQNLPLAWRSGEADYPASSRGYLCLPPAGIITFCHHTRHFYVRPRDLTQVLVLARQALC